MTKTQLLNTIYLNLFKDTKMEKQFLDNMERFKKNFKKNYLEQIMNYTYKYNKEQDAHFVMSLLLVK